MTLQQVIDKFRRYPKALDNGAGNLSRRWKCDKETIYEARKIVRDEIKRFTPEEIKKLPKVLLFDIEISPSIAYSFQRWNVNLSIDQIIQDPIMLTWSAKWLYNTEILGDKITLDELKQFDDKRIVKSLWKLLDEADIVIAHFGDKFDIPILNTRAIIHGLSPYSSIKSIDTKKVVSSTFKFPSNKLDALATYFGLEGKLKSGFNLWKSCLQGSDHTRQVHLDKMFIYNIQDVKLLEEIYLILRPWIKSHPNVGLYIESDTTVCSNCGSKHIEKTDKFYYTSAGKYPVYRCECGALTRGRFNEYDKEKRKNLTLSIAK